MYPQPEIFHVIHLFCTNAIPQNMNTMHVIPIFTLLSLGLKKDSHFLTDVVSMMTLFSSTGYINMARRDSPYIHVPNSWVENENKCNEQILGAGWIDRGQVNFKSTSPQGM